MAIFDAVAINGACTLPEKNIVFVLKRYYLLLVIKCTNFEFRISNGSRDTYLRQIDKKSFLTPFMSRKQCAGGPMLIETLFLRISQRIPFLYTCFEAYCILYTSTNL